MRYKCVLIFVFVISYLGKASGQKIANFDIGEAGIRWVDSVYNSLSPQRKIGQLFMIAEYSDPGQSTKDETACLISEYGLGGICMFKGSPMKQALLVNKLQSLSKIPMLISMDAEWGLAMRLDSVVSYPKQMALAASNDTNAIYSFATQVAEQCRRLGVHISFSPVSDVNNNRLNPIIGDRSFGQDKNKVALYANSYMSGLQDNKIMACAKHFPGHGNTESDSHLDLPVINQSASELDSVELVPFKYLFDHGIKSVMAAHLYIPAIDSTPNQATSLSPLCVKNLLRDKLNFQGLVFTDGLAMKGVAKYFLPHELNLKALKAGNDVLLCPEDVPQSVTRILDALSAGEITQDEIEIKVKKILAAKYWCGLNEYKPIDTTQLNSSMLLPKYVANRNQTALKSIIVLKNENHLIPYLNKADKKLLVLNVGYSQPTNFENKAWQYTGGKIVNLDKYQPKTYFDSVLNWIKKQDFDVIIASLHNTSRFITKKYGFMPEAVSFINSLPKKNTLYVHFGNLYALDSFPNFRNLLVAHEDWEYWQDAAAEAVFSGFSEKHTASMPISTGGEFAISDGITEKLSAVNNLKFKTGYESGIDEGKLYKIDSICNQAILAKAFPGCQVLAAKNGNIFYHKAFGTNSYSDTTKVRLDQLYDIASVSKILSTTMGVMKLYAAHKIKLDEKLSKYIKELRRTNKKNITIREVLTHTAGLQEWIPFYVNTLDTNAKPDTLVYHSQQNHDFTLLVADGMYMKRAYLDTLDKIIYNSPLKNKGSYAYSDLGFILLKKLVEKVSGDDFDEYVQKMIYKPLGLKHITWNPLQNGYSKKDIIPTEYDSVYRQQLIHGYVHDPAAAMMGGVAGHAGLFANAFDVAQIMQFLLNKGTYNQISLFSPETVDTFNSKQNSVRRGLGFDKPETTPGKPSPCSVYASPQTFGHQGFTGTCTWADPESGIIYVFLSNRVNPSALNTKITQMSVRSAIHDAIYKAQLKEN